MKCWTLLSMTLMFEPVFFLSWIPTCYVEEFCDVKIFKWRGMLHDCWTQFPSQKDLVSDTYFYSLNFFPNELIDYTV